MLIWSQRFVSFCSLIKAFNAWCTLYVYYLYFSFCVYLTYYNRTKLGVFLNYNVPQTWTLQLWVFSEGVGLSGVDKIISVLPSGRVFHLLSNSLVLSLVRSHAWRHVVMNLRGTFALLSSEKHVLNKLVNCFFYLFPWYVQSI